MTAFHLRELDAKAVKTWLDSNDTVLIDVREPAEHARERIAGAKLLPLSSLSAQSKIETGGATRIVLHCASGHRSAKAAQILHAQGFREIAHLKGGLPAWRQAGFPTVVDTRAPLPLMRQVQIAAGTLVLLGVVLGALVNPGFYALSAFVGAGLVFAGTTGWCGMAMLLARLPYNRRAVS